MESINLDTIESTQLILTRMNALKEDCKLIDVVLIAGRDNENVPAHRLVLASRSDYFHAMFTSSFSEYKKLEIRINGVSGNELTDIIKYCYSGIINLGEENVERILATASLFKLKDLVKACCDLLVNRMNTTNCLKLWTMAEKYKCINLLEPAKVHTCFNFMDVCKSEEFLTLDYRRLQELLACDELSVNSEDDIFLSLIRWLQHDQNEREKYIRDLLPLVRVPFLSPTFVDEQKDFIIDSVGDLTFIREIFQWHLTPIENRPAIQIRQRKWINETLLAVMTGYEDGIIRIEKYCQKKDKWTTWATVEQDQKRTLFGAAIMDNELITAGGRLGNDVSKSVNTVISINTKTKKAKCLEPMRACRRFATLVALDDYIYSIGGRDNRGNWLNCVERWSRRTCTWNSVAPMIEEKEGQNAAVLNGKIYVIGDSTAVECYDPQTNSWSTNASMHEKRYIPGIAVINNYLYAIGGQGSKTMERYNSKTNTWVMMCSMSNPRYQFGCIAIGDRIIAVGGLNGGKALNIMEEYNSTTNIWTQKTNFNNAGECVIVRASDIS